MVEAQVGWRPSSPQAALAFLPPEPIDPSLGLGRNVLVVRCPYDLTIEVTPPAVRPARFTRVPEPGGLSAAGFTGLVTPIAPTAQRDPEVPAVQISLNLILVTDEVAALHLTPPFLDPGFRAWPGSLVSGRFPLRAWPRSLNAVLEWQDRTRPWRLRRGDPMVYLWLSFDDPAKVLTLVEAASTPTLARHLAQVDNVSAFARNVGPMFGQAEARRPERLLTAKGVGCPGFS